MKLNDAARLNTGEICAMSELRKRVELFLEIYLFEVPRQDELNSSLAYLLPYF